MNESTLLKFLISVQDIPRDAILFVNPDNYDDYFVGDNNTNPHPKYVRTYWQWNRSCDLRKNLRSEIFSFLKGRSDNKGNFEYLGKKYNYDGVFNLYESGQLPDELKPGQRMKSAPSLKYCLKSTLRFLLKSLCRDTLRSYLKNKDLLGQKR